MCVDLKLSSVLYNVWFSVRNLNVVAQKRSGRPRKSWDEVIKNDRKKLDMDSADPQNRSEWRGRLRGRLVKKPNPRKRKTGSKTDMMMMMMMICIHSTQSM